jgi:hypothetical protein
MRAFIQCTARRRDPWPPQSRPRVCSFPPTPAPCTSQAQHPFRQLRCSARRIRSPTAHLSPQTLQSTLSKVHRGWSRYTVDDSGGNCQRLRCRISDELQSGNFRVKSAFYPNNFPQSVSVDFRQALSTVQTRNILQPTIWTVRTLALSRQYGPTHVIDFRYHGRVGKVRSDGVTVDRNLLHSMHRRGVPFAGQRVSLRGVKAHGQVKFPLRRGQPVGFSVLAGALVLEIKIE